MTMQRSLRSALCLAVWLAPLAAAAQISCQSRDAITGACLGTPVSAAAKPKAVASPDAAAATALEGDSPFIPGLPTGVVKDGRKVCVKFSPNNPGADRSCQLWATQQADYESAMQAGIEAASNSMLIMRDAQNRAAALGMYGSAAQLSGISNTAPSASVARTPQSSPSAAKSVGSASLDAFKSCVKAKSRLAASVAGRELDAQETQSVMDACDAK